MSWLARKIVRNTGWLFIGQFGVLLINFLAVLLVARFLGPELFGRLSFVIAGVALIVPFAQLGLNSIVTRDLVRSPADREEILGTSLVLRMFGGVIAIGLGMSAIYTLRPDDSSIQLYFLLLLVGQSFQAFMVFSHWMESEVNGRLVAICQLLISFALALTRIALVYTGAPLIAFIVVEALNSVLIAVVFGGAYVVGGHSLANLRFSMARATNLLRQCAPLIASSITAVIYLKIDQVMIGEIVGDSEVGIYALAARISEFWYFIPTIIVTSAFPFLLKDQERKTGRYEQRLQQLMDLLLWLGIGFAFALSILGPLVVRGMFGEVYASSADILLIHLWGGIFISMRALVSKWILAEGVLIFSLVSQGAGAFTNILLNLILIPTYGAYGAAVATVVSYAVAAYFSLMIFERTRPMVRIMTLAFYAPLRVVMKRA